MDERNTTYFSAGLRNFLSIIGAYLLTFYFEHFIRYIIGVASGLAANFSIYGVNFLATNSEWVDCDCVVITYITGPLILAITGVVFYQRLNNKLEIGITLSRFAFWLSIFSLTRFLGGFLAGWLTHKGLWFAMSWAYLPSTIQLVGSGVLFLALVILCFRIRVGVLANEGISVRILEAKKYYPFAGYRLILPYVIAAGLLYLLFLRNQGWYELIIFAMTGLVLLPILFGGNAMRLQLYKFPDFSLRD